MPTHVAFLRAINLGSRRVFSIADQRRVAEAAGFTDVAVHLQTGNLRVTSRRRSTEAVTRALEAAFEADRGFAVPTAVLDLPTLREAARRSVELGGEWPGRRYLAFLRDEPSPDAVSALAAALEAAIAARPERHEERAVVEGRVVHLAMGGGYQNVYLDNGRLERLLGVTSTTRAATVVERCARDWAGDWAGG